MLASLLTFNAAELPITVNSPSSEVRKSIMLGRVSVIIHAFSRLSYLKQPVRAALLPPYYDTEVNISQNPKVKRYTNPSNRGLLGNYKAYGSRVTGKYIIIVGDDDTLLPHSVEKMTGSTASGADVIFCNRFLIDEHGHRKVGGLEKFDNDYLLTTGLVPDAEKVTWVNLVLLSGAAIRTKSLLAVGFNSDNNLEDIALLGKLGGLFHEFYFIRERSVRLRVHSISATGSGSSTFHHLLKFISIKIKPEVENLKRTCIAYLMAPAAKLCLQDNNIASANELRMRYV